MVGAFINNEEAEDCVLHPLSLAVKWAQREMYVWLPMWLPMWLPPLCLQI